MSHSISHPTFPHIAPAFLEEILFALFQTFMAGASGDIAAARAAALAALAAYDPQDEQELRLAAQIIQYSFGALDALARALDPGLPLNTLLRLRGSANALQRSANQCQRTLERLRKDRRQPQPQQATAEPAAQPAATLSPRDPGLPVMAGPDPAICAPATPHSPPVVTDAPAAPPQTATAAKPQPIPTPAALPDAPPADADEPAPVPWESMFRPLPPDAEDDYPALLPAA